MILATRTENYMHAMIRSYTKLAGNKPYPSTSSLNTVCHLYEVKSGVLPPIQFPRLHSLQSSKAVTSPNNSRRQAAKQPR